MHPSEWYNSVQAAVGLDPSQRGTWGVATKTEPLFAKGMSFEDMSKATGVPVSQIRDYAATAHPTYGIAGKTDTTQNDAPPTGGGTNTAAAKTRTGDDPALVAQARGQVKTRASDIDQIYQSLFGQLDQLLRSRADDTEKQYGDQFNTTADSYAKSIPEIEKSYAAIGAGNSTDQADAKDTAHTGFETANKTIQHNKEADLAKIGQYGQETKGKWNADLDSVHRMAAGVDTNESLSDLTSARNDADTKLTGAQATAASLGTDEGARGSLSALTSDAGRFESVKGALDNIMKGSMSGAVKQAAVQSVVDSGGLSEADKQKVKQLYGNVYDTPVAA